MNVNDRLTDPSTNLPKPLEVSKAWVGLLPGEPRPKTDFENGRAAIAELRAVIKEANSLLKGEPKPHKRRPSTGFANRHPMESAA